MGTKIQYTLSPEIIAESNARRAAFEAARAAERAAAMTPEQREREARADADKVARAAARAQEQAEQSARAAAFQQAEDDKVARRAAGMTWEHDPASARQIEYIRSLGVNLSNEYAARLTKGAASELISSVKTGNGVGSFGLFFNDGSN